MEEGNDPEDIFTVIPKASELWAALYLDHENKD